MKIENQGSLCTENLNNKADVSNWHIRSNDLGKMGYLPSSRIAT